jgi:hypothetical protein
MVNSEGKRMTYLPATCVTPSHVGPLQKYVDGSKVPGGMQDPAYNNACKNVAKWGAKAVLLRSYTTSAVHQVDEQVSFVYVDARVSEGPTG